MTSEEMRLLYDYNSWANRRILDVCAALTDEQFTRDLASSFRSVRDTLAHIMGAEWIWLERWRGSSPGALPKADQFPNLASLRQRWAELESDLLRFVASLSQEALTGALSYRTFDGKPQSQPLWQMLQHLANHGSYHRGQVTTMLRQLGAKPVSTDLIGFYRELSSQPRG